MVNKNKIIEPNLEAMAESGVHLGTLRSTSNPKMKPYIWSSKNAFQIINLEESKKNLDAALEFLAKIKENGGVILFVGTGMAAKKITQKVEKGFSVGLAMSNEKIFPESLVQMAIVGEQTGHLDETLMKLAEYYQTESEMAVKAMLALLEPSIIIFLGLTVGSIIMAIITPIFSITQSF